MTIKNEQKIIISCPICKKDFPVDEAIKNQLVENTTKEAREKIKQEQDLLLKKEKEIEQKQQKIDKQESTFNAKVKSEVEKKFETEKIKITKEAEKKAQEKLQVELKDKDEQIKEKDEALKKSQDAEIIARKKEREADEKVKNAELEIARTVSIEKGKIEEDVSKRFAEEYRFRELESEKKMSDLISQLNEAKRKAEQKSQQLQGEVQELDLEQVLQDNFPDDEIIPVEKGQSGADVRQVVKSPGGKNCGTILWESKRTKNWSDGWLQKLKDDLRKEAANVPVIISAVLPEEAKTGIGFKEGVYVCSPTFAIMLSEMLRQRLIAVAREKNLAENKETKASLLYEYITSHEFIQQVQAMVEVYQNMQEQVQRERNSYEKTWKTREEQIKRMFSATSNIIGSFQGKIGPSMPTIKGLELLESGEEKEEK